MNSGVDNKRVDVLLCGRGGQGVLTAGEVLAEAAFIENFDVKKSELHGMSQRGGSVDCVVRWGREVSSPLMPSGEADFLIALKQEEVELYRHLLSADARILVPPEELPEELPDKRCLNMYMLGKLSCWLDFSPDTWQKVMQIKIRAKFQDINKIAFNLGAESERKIKEGEGK